MSPVREHPPRALTVPGPGVGGRAEGRSGAPERDVKNYRWLRDSCTTLRPPACDRLRPGRRSRVRGQMTGQMLSADDRWRAVLELSRRRDPQIPPGIPPSVPIPLMHWMPSLRRRKMSDHSPRRDRERDGDRELNGSGENGVIRAVRPRGLTVSPLREWNRRKLKRGGSALGVLGWGWGTLSTGPSTGDAKNKNQGMI